MASLGDFLSSINYKKNDVLADDPLAEKDYVPFVINKTLSYFNDTIFYANEMNIAHDLPKKMQYDFLRHTIRARSRFKKWDKKKTIDDINLVKEYYNYSTSKAEQIIDLLTDEQIDYIRQQLFKGGV